MFAFSVFTISFSWKKDYRPVWILQQSQKGGVEANFKILLQIFKCKLCLPAALHDNPTYHEGTMDSYL